MKPNPGQWGRLIAQRADRAGRFVGQRSRFRQQLGLRATGPVIMSGHQCGFWHPGILAKYLALRASSWLGTTAWLVADLDANEPTRVRHPERTQAGVVHAQTVDLCVADGPARDVPTGLRPPLTAVDDIPEDLVEARDALRSSALNASSLARQVHQAVLILLDKLGLAGQEQTIYASSISKTDLFAAFLEEMTRDPQACVRAYNRAARDHPQAHVRLLRGDDESGWECPIWRVSPGMSRQSVRVRTGDALDPLQHAPKALCMTGLLRLGACDLFIHGTGGGEYDRVTDQWLDEWLKLTPASTAVVSATMRLDLGFGNMTLDQALAALNIAHRAHHDPALLGDQKAASAKLSLVKQIAASSQHSQTRHQAFRDMHQMLSRVRAAHSEELSAFEQHAATARAVLRSREAVMDRTWPFFLYEKNALKRLDQRVAEMMTPAATMRP